MEDKSTNPKGNDQVAPAVLRPSNPDPALRRLDRLVGTWEISGRTLGSKEDNIRGRVTIAWLPGEFFLEQRGHMTFMDATIDSLEIVGYDPAMDTFPSTVYSNLGGIPVTYFWDVQGNTVTHWEEGSKYTGTLSEDSRTLTGGWRPVKGYSGPDNTYDAIMTRVD